MCFLFIQESVEYSGYISIVLVVLDEIEKLIGQPWYFGSILQYALPPVFTGKREQWVLIVSDRCFTLFTC